MTFDEDDEDASICGDTYDHELTMIAEGDDGINTYMCENCGAELIGEDLDD